MSAERKERKAANREALEKGRELRYAIWFQVVWASKRADTTAPIEHLRLIKRVQFQKTLRENKP